MRLNKILFLHLCLFACWAIMEGQREYNSPSEVWDAANSQNQISANCDKKEIVQAVHLIVQKNEQKEARGHISAGTKLELCMYMKKIPKSAKTSCVDADQKTSQYGKQNWQIISRWNGLHVCDFNDLVKVKIGPVSTDIAKVFVLVQSQTRTYTAVANDYLSPSCGWSCGDTHAHERRFERFYRILPEFGRPPLIDLNGNGDGKEDMIDELFVMVHTAYKDNANTVKASDLKQGSQENNELPFFHLIADARYTIQLRYGRFQKGLTDIIRMTTLKLLSHVEFINLTHDKILKRYGQKDAKKWEKNLVDETNMSANIRNAEIGRVAYMSFEAASEKTWYFDRVAVLIRANNGHFYVPILNIQDTSFDIKHSTSSEYSSLSGAFNYEENKDMKIDVDSDYSHEDCKGIMTNKECEARAISLFADCYTHKESGDCCIAYGTKTANGDDQIYEENPKCSSMEPSTGDSVYVRKADKDDSATTNRGVILRMIPKWIESATNAHYRPGFFGGRWRYFQRIDSNSGGFTYTRTEEEGLEESTETAKSDARAHESGWEMSGGLEMCAGLEIGKGGISMEFTGCASYTVSSYASKTTGTEVVTGHTTTMAVSTANECSVELACTGASVTTLDDLANIDATSTACYAWQWIAFGFDAQTGKIQEIETCSFAVLDKYYHRPQCGEDDCDDISDCQRCLSNQSPVKNRCPHEIGMEYQGSGIGSTKSGVIKNVALHTDCAAMCGADRRCKSYSYSRNANKCFLKRKLRPTRKRTQGFISGVPCMDAGAIAVLSSKAEECTKRHEIAMDCKPCMDYGFKGCEKLCTENNCKFWTLYDTGECRIYSNCEGAIGDYFNNGGKQTDWAVALSAVGTNGFRTYFHLNDTTTSESSVGTNGEAGVGTSVATPVDCAGSWSTCNIRCQKIYVITQNKKNNGKACPHTNGEIANCSGDDCKEVKPRALFASGLQLQINYDKNIYLHPQFDGSFGLYVKEDKERNYLSAKSYLDENNSEVDFSNKFLNTWESKFYILPLGKLKYNIFIYDKEGTKYYLNMCHVNPDGSFQSTLPSDDDCGIFTFYPPLKEEEDTCFDGKQNGEELGVDCGGPSCHPCIRRLACQCTGATNEKGEGGAACDSTDNSGKNWCFTASGACSDGSPSLELDNADISTTACADELSIKNAHFVKGKALSGREVAYCMDGDRTTWCQGESEEVNKLNFGLGRFVEVHRVQIFKSPSAAGVINYEHAAIRVGTELCGFVSFKQAQKDVITVNCPKPIKDHSRVSVHFWKSTPSMSDFKIFGRKFRPLEKLRLASAIIHKKNDLSTQLDASKCIDGNRETQCEGPDGDGRDRLTITLEKPAKIEEIVISVPENYAHYLEDTYVDFVHSVSGAPRQCTQISARQTVATNTITVICAQNMDLFENGMYSKIHIDGEMILSNVQVFGYQDSSGLNDCVERTISAPCNEQVTREACLNTKESRELMVADVQIQNSHCAWCNGPCTTSSETQCRPVNALEAQHITTFERCIVEERIKGLCLEHEIELDDVTKRVCKANENRCEVSIKPGSVDGYMVSDGHDFCAKHGLMCIAMFDVTQNDICEMGMQYLSCSEKLGANKRAYVRCAPTDHNILVHKVVELLDGTEMDYDTNAKNMVDGYDAKGYFNPRYCSSFKEMLGNTTMCDRTLCNFEYIEDTGIVDRMCRDELCLGCKQCAGRLPISNAKVQIDLGKPYDIERLVIHGSATCPYKFKRPTDTDNGSDSELYEVQDCLEGDSRIKVYISDKKQGAVADENFCGKAHLNDANGIAFQCDLSGRYVTLAHVRTVCEVRAYQKGCGYGFQQIGSLSKNNQIWDDERQINKFWNLEHIDDCKEKCVLNKKCLAFRYGTMAADGTGFIECSLFGSLKPNGNDGSNVRFCAKLSDTIWEQCFNSYTRCADTDDEGIVLDNLYLCEAIAKSRGHEYMQYCAETKICHTVATCNDPILDNPDTDKDWRVYGSKCGSDYTALKSYNWMNLRWHQTCTNALESAYNTDVVDCVKAIQYDPRCRQDFIVRDTLGKKCMCIPKDENCDLAHQVDHDIYYRTNKALMSPYSCQVACQVIGYSTDVSTDIPMSSSHQLSCPQACDISRRGTTITECRTLCHDTDTCTQSKNGITYNKCSSSIDESFLEECKDGCEFGHNPCAIEYNVTYVDPINFDIYKSERGIETAQECADICRMDKVCKSWTWVSKESHKHYKKCLKLVGFGLALRKAAKMNDCCASGLKCAGQYLVPITEARRSLGEELEHEAETILGDNHDIYDGRRILTEPPSEAKVAAQNTFAIHGTIVINGNIYAKGEEVKYYDSWLQRDNLKCEDISATPISVDSIQECKDHFVVDSVPQKFEDKTIIGFHYNFLEENKKCYGIYSCEESIFSPGQDAYFFKAGEPITQLEFKDARLSSVYPDPEGIHPMKFTADKCIDNDVDSFCHGNDLINGDTLTLKLKKPARVVKITIESRRNLDDAHSLRERLKNSVVKVGDEICATIPYRVSIKDTIDLYCDNVRGKSNIISIQTRQDYLNIAEVYAYEPEEDNDEDSEHYYNRLTNFVDEFIDEYATLSQELYQLQKLESDQEKLYKKEQTWSPWTACSKECDTGSRIRERIHPLKTMTEVESGICNTSPCQKGCPYKDNVKLTGSVLVTLTDTVRPEQCSNFCSLDGKCAFWTYYKSGPKANQCIMMEKNKKTSTDPTAASGDPCFTMFDDRTLNEIDAFLEQSELEAMVGVEEAAKIRASKEKPSNTTNYTWALICVAILVIFTTRQVMRKSENHNQWAALATTLADDI